MVSFGAIAGGLSATYPGQQAAQQQSNQLLMQQIAIDDYRAAQAGKQALGTTFQAMMPGMQQLQAPPQQQPQMPQQAPPGGAPPPGMPPNPGQASVPAGQVANRFPQVAQVGQGPSGQPIQRIGPPPGAMPSQQQRPPQQAPGGGGGPLGMGQFDLKTAAQAIAKANPGIDGRTLVEALNQALPYLKVEAQQEVIQMRMQLQEQNLQVRRDALDARRDAMEQRGEQFQERETRLTKENEARQERFSAREARLGAQAQVRQDQGWMRLELQKQDLMRKFSEGDQRIQLRQIEDVIKLQKQRADTALRASNAFNTMDDKEKQKLLDENLKQYQEDM
jgi:hypothetical protein